MDIRDKVAVITGSVSGLGHATAQLFVQEGARVVLFDLNDALGHRIEAELGERAVFANVDVTREDSVKSGLALAKARFGAVHICVNCAGVAPSGKTLGRKGPLPLEHYQRVVAINPIGTFNVMRLVAEVMSHRNPVTEDGERGVVIIRRRWRPLKARWASASKGGVVSMTLPAARDLGNL